MNALRLSVNPPPGGEFRLENGSAISPDGRLIVYLAHTGDVDRLWLRPLGSLSARELPGTDGATSPFWSADSRSVGFFASGKLQRTDVAGGSPVPLCNATGGRGGTWNAEGVILFNGYNDGPILMVSAAGGDPVPLTTIDESRTENSHRWPQFLPDGRQFLYFVRAVSPQVQGYTSVRSIAGTTKDGCWGPPPRLGMRLQRRDSAAICSGCGTTASWRNHLTRPPHN